ncbi:hypothetical protein FQA39_LY11378 [Lamprigera yunnana]|nr:hypothetical protein FQA39_LY11378 [Lamprigera yunnana]
MDSELTFKSLKEHTAYIEKGLEEITFNLAVLTSNVAMPKVDYTKQFEEEFNILQKSLDDVIKTLRKDTEDQNKLLLQCKGTLRETKEFIDLCKSMKIMPIQISESNVVTADNSVVIEETIQNQEMEINDSKTKDDESSEPVDAVVTINFIYLTTHQVRPVLILATGKFRWLQFREDSLFTCILFHNKSFVCEDIIVQ